jgi:hypothetical protein
MKRKADRRDHLKSRTNKYELVEQLMAPDQTVPKTIIEQYFEDIHLKKLFFTVGSAPGQGADHLQAN